MSIPEAADLSAPSPVETPLRVLVIQHDADDALNELSGPLLDAGLQLVPWCTWVSPTPPDPLAGPFAGVISLGSAASAIDLSAESWMSIEHSLLKEALADGVPVLGICFGSQILAAAAGGRVRRAAVAEIGWTRVDATSEAADDRLLGGFGASYPAFHFHYDTFDLPEHTPEPVGGLPVTVLGRTGDLIEAYRVGAAAWGLQFHLEANPGVVTSWLGAFADEFAAEGVDPGRLHEDTVRHWRGYRDLAWQAAAAFAALVRERGHQS